MALGNSLDRNPIGFEEWAANGTSGTGCPRTGPLHRPRERGRYAHRGSHLVSTPTARAVMGYLRRSLLGDGQGARRDFGIPRFGMQRPRPLRALLVKGGRKHNFCRIVGREIVL